MEGLVLTARVSPTQITFNERPREIERLCCVQLKDCYLGFQPTTITTWRAARKSEVGPKMLRPMCRTLGTSGEEKLGKH